MAIIRHTYSSKFTVFYEILKSDFNNHSHNAIVLHISAGKINMYRHY